MNFEEALSALRKGSKVRHPAFAKDEYLQACRVGLIGSDKPKSEWPISIVKMKGDRQSDETAGVLCYVAKIKRQLKKILMEEDYKKYHNAYTEIEIGKIFDDDIFKCQQLGLHLVMRDDWELYEN